MRLASLILGSTPFAVILTFVYLLFTSEGWAGVGYILMIIVAIPVSLLLSITSVVVAFLKTTNLKLDLAAKITSLFSVSVFGVGTGLVAFLYFTAQAAYSNYIG